MWIASRVDGTRQILYMHRFETDRRLQRCFGFDILESTLQTICSRCLVEMFEIYETEMGRGDTLESSHWQFIFCLLSPNNTTSSPIFFISLLRSSALMSDPPLITDCDILIHGADLSGMTQEPITVVAQWLCQNKYIGQKPMQDALRLRQRDDLPGKPWMVTMPGKGQGCSDDGQL